MCTGAKEPRTPFSASSAAASPHWGSPPKGTLTIPKQGGEEKTNPGRQECSHPKEGTQPPRLIPELRQPSAWADYWYAGRGCASHWRSTIRPTHPSLPNLPVEICSSAKRHPSLPGLPQTSSTPMQDPPHIHGCPSLHDLQSPAVKRAEIND